MHRFVLFVALLVTAIFSLGGLNNGAARAEETFPIVISEIGAAAPSDHEWIEIVNRSVVAVDLTGWKFYESDTNHSLAVVQGSSMLEPLQYAVIADNASYFLEDHPGFSGTLFDSSWGSLNDDGELIGLKDATGLLLEQFSYLAAEDGSLERIDFLFDDYTSVNWCERESGDSAGMANNGCGANLTEISFFVEDDQQVLEVDVTTPDSTVASSVSTSDVSVVSFVPLSASDIFLSEVLPYPLEGESEWVELFIQREGSFTLDGLYLSDSTANRFALSGSGTGPAFVLFSDLSFTLNNSGDTVTIATSDGVTIDATTYGTADLAAPLQGQSVGRTSDGFWQGYPVPTPATENIFINTSPTAVVTLQSGAWSGTDSLTVNVSGEDSVDVNGDSLTFFWDFGDGETSTSANPSNHTYGVGTYTLRLTVTDQWGAAAAFTQTVTVTGSTTTTSTADSASSGSSSVSSSVVSDGIDSSDSSVAGGSSIDPSVVPILPQTDFSLLQLFITEIFPNPSGKDAGHEWVEIFNGSDTTVDLSGWSLQNGATHARTVLFPSSLLPPDTYSLITLSGSFLRNQADTISLIAPDGAVMDLLSYTAAPEHESYALDDTGEFVWTSSFTPGTANLLSSFSESVEEVFAENDSESSVLSVTTGTSTKTRKKSRTVSYANGDLSSAIFFNEVFPNPTGSDKEKEWIELVNTGDVFVSLGNWVIDDGDGGSKPYVIPDTVGIAPFATLLLMRSDTGITLDNTGDTLQLFTFEHDLQDSVTYADVQEDSSYARITFSRLPPHDATIVSAAAVDTFWEWTTDVTPGTPNPSYTVVRGTVEDWNNTILSLLSEDGTVLTFAVSEREGQSGIFDALFIDGGVLDVTYWKDADAVLHFVSATPVETDFAVEPASFFPLHILRWIGLSLLFVFVFVFTLLNHRRTVRPAVPDQQSLSAVSEIPAVRTVLPPVLENQSPFRKDHPPDQ